MNVQRRRLQQWRRRCCAATRKNHCRHRDVKRFVQRRHRSNQPGCGEPGDWGITGLAAEDEDIVRIGGADRYATSLAIAQYFSAGSGVSAGGTTICIATGRNFPDALAGSIYAAKRGAPIILADGSLSEEAVNYLESLKVHEAAIFGGTGVVSQSIEQKLRELTKK